MNNTNNIDIETYKKCKSKYEFIQTNLQEIIDMCLELENLLTDSSADPEDVNFLNLGPFKDLIKLDHQQIRSKHEKICKKIYNNCQHEFVKDLVDITPDKSQHISYCKFCEMTEI